VPLVILYRMVLVCQVVLAWPIVKYKILQLANAQLATLVIKLILEFAKHALLSLNALLTLHRVHVILVKQDINYQMVFVKIVV